MKVEALDGASSTSFLFLLLLLWPVVVAEEFFHYRDRGDNVEYRQMEDKNIVTSIEKAKDVLRRYGYLTCSYHRKRGGRHRHKEGRGGRRCTEDEVRKAILKYQITYNMPLTGHFDEATLKTMSESRCGNTDDEMAKLFRPMVKPKMRHDSKSQSYQPLARHRRDAGGTPAKYTLGGTAPDGLSTNTFPREVSSNLILKSLREATLRGTTMVRRRKWLENYMKDMTSGELDRRLEGQHHLIQKTRRRRSVPSGVEGQAFTANFITWRLVGSAYSNQLTENTQRSALALAFRMWGEVIPLVFQEDTRSAVDDVDILVAFGKGEHMNCPNNFDGYGGQLSHAIKMSSNAEIHVDDDEQLTVGSQYGTNLVKVAVHEVGHALGLFHTSRNYSIMYAIYSQVIPNNNFELCWEDRKLVQNIYGVCKIRFHTVFDWVRRRPDGQLIYNTYFFRNNHYWMYENRHNRTRFGDPLRIAPEWKGVPDNVDGFVHVWTYLHDVNYFFKGHKYWLYNSAEDKIASDYPRNISSDFRAMTGTTFPNIPGHLDSVFFDKRDGNIYFFKGHLVYAYDVSKGQEGCCLPGYPKPLNQVYPGVNKESNLPPHLDAVYYSYTDRAMYFFKGIYYWKNIAFNLMDRRNSNRVKGPWLISTRWFDICDVDN